jgi:two-component system torCAD operon response regulator TorR
VTEAHIASTVRDALKAAVPRILVVEDQEVIQDLLLTIFGHEGFEARCAGTVAEAMAELVNRPDFVVLDLHLPDGRGTQILQEIRHRDMRVKVAVTTGTIDAALIGAADRLHPDKFFHKPYRAMELVQWIRSSSPPVVPATPQLRAAS